MADSVPLSPLKQAFFALQQANARIADLEAQRDQPIAVVGMDCRFPGGVANAEHYWDLLSQKTDAVNSRMQARWTECGAGQFNLDPSLNRGALIDDPALFDAAFFGISPREATYIDPQQRLLLEVSWAALEDAGIAPDSTFSSRTGVYFGIAGGDYAQLELATGGYAAINPHFASGSAHSVASGRVSYTLGLRGPSLSIDTACSSSLVAVHHACAGLRNGDCDLALAGGVNLILTPESSIAFSRSGMLSARGVLASFSSAADGFVRGEGCGVVVLKRLRDAEANGDRILGVIRGSAVNHDGPTSGLTVPSGQAQQLLLRAALASANLSPSAIGYVEAHGTGTRLGDPIEAEALGAVFAGERANPLAIGSVKTNLGHLEAAAGMAGLIKLLLALEHRQIPAQLHFDEPSPLIRWNELPLEVVTRQRAWEPINGRRIGGVSAFGFSGTNAHVIVEEAPPRAAKPNTARDTEVLPVSAKTEAALTRMVTRYREYLESHPDLRWAEVCHTAAVGRTHFRYRVAIVAASLAEAIVSLRAYEQEESHPGLVRDAALNAWLKQAAAAPRELSAEELAQAYVAGAEIDWAAWNRDQIRERIRLPGYAFERARHWFRAASKPSKVHSSGTSTGHPLLGSRLRSAAVAVQYEQLITLTGELAWLADHRIGGRVLMPATAYAELLLAAADRLSGPGAALLEELLFSRPLELDRECLLQLLVEPAEARPGSQRVRIYSTAADGEPQWMLHAEGTVRRQPLTAEELTLDLEAIRARCTDVLDGASFYRGLEARGADFGPYFRQVERVWSNGNEALAEVKLARLGERLHPASLDACLQVAAALFDFGNDQTLLPLSLGSLAFRTTDLPEKALVYVTRDVETGSGQTQVLRVNLQIFAPDQTPLIDPINVAFASENKERTSNPADWFYEIKWQESVLAPQSKTLPMQWMLILQDLTPDDPFVDQVSEALRKRGQQSAAFVMARGAEQAPTALEEMLRSGTSRLVFLHRPLRLNQEQSAGVTDAARPTIEAMLDLSRALAASRSSAKRRLYVLTHSSHSVAQNQEMANPLEVLISGVAATLAAEDPSVGCTRLDVDLEITGLGADAIVTEMLADHQEDWVSLCGETRFVPRLQPHQAIADIPAALTFTPGAGLTSLAYQPIEPHKLAPDEIEIEVCAAALNFHDVLAAIDLLPDKDPLGAECSGIVRRVGSGVTRFSDGDEVLAIAIGCFATYAIATEPLVFRKPASLSFEQAASLPIAYLTAHYCLHSLARISSGQRVLIHAASGGVGLAAVYLCQRAGAEIFVTAGSDAKREYLSSLGVEHVMDSRSELFASQVKALTNGRGVHVVLNSLAGRLTDAGLAVTAPGGLFIDIGKTDIRQASRVAEEFPAVRYQAVDLTRQLVDSPGEMGDRLTGILNEITAGQLPALPISNFDWEDPAKAFRHMAAARHIGKVVLFKPPLPPRVLEVSTSSSYLVTGGLTGLGLEAVEWLASKKAGKVVIVARRPASVACEQRLEEVRRQGVELAIITGDIAHPEVVRRAMEVAGTALRGILHCAGAIDDAPMVKQTWENFNQAFDGKANGAWLLHQATRSQALDFFVLFSSWASLAGAPGAANYSAANLFLDALAGYRRRLGLVATSLSWGPWRALGMTAQREERDFSQRGFIPFTALDGRRALEYATLRPMPAHVAVAQVDWYKFEQSTDSGGVASSLYTGLLPLAFHQEPEPPPALAPSASLVEKLRSSSPQLRMLLLKQHVDETLASILGLGTAEEIDPDQPLEAIGMDSILSIEVKNALSSQFGLSLPMTLLFDYPAAGALTRYLAERLHLRDGASEELEMKTLLDELETMSDDEVMKVLTALK